MGQDVFNSHYHALYMNGLATPFYYLGGMDLLQHEEQLPDGMHTTACTTPHSSLPPPLPPRACLLHHTLQSLAPDDSLLHLLRRLLLPLIVNVHFGVVRP